MTKHTPGPWVLGPEDARGFRIYAQGGTLYFLDANPLDCDQVSPMTFRERRERQKADARLIAAAPDLLAALINAEDRMAVVLENDSESGQPEDTDLIAAWKAAKAAIAKATGHE